ncbi:MAG: cyclic nucleotide-binding domain-containing protein [Clostridium fessum]
MASNYKTCASLNLTLFEMQLLSHSPLFRGAGESGIGEMLSCLGAEERSYEKEEMIYRAGNTVTSLGVVMHGSVMIVNDDLWGNRSILDRVEPGQIFAETYACVPGEKLLVDVFAAEVTEVLFLNVGKMLSQCPNSCGHHTQLIRNLLAISAQKTCSCPAGSSIHRRNPSGDGFCRTSPIRR